MLLLMDDGLAFFIHGAIELKIRCRWRIPLGIGICPLIFLRVICHGIAGYPFYPIKFGFLP